MILNHSIVLAPNFRLLPGYPADGRHGRCRRVLLRPDTVRTIECRKGVSRHRRRWQGQRRLGPYIGAMALGLAALLSSTGCAILGAGIGSTIPKYEPLSEEPIVKEASLGQRVRVVRASDGHEFAGRYAGVYDEKLWIATPEGASAVDAHDVKSARVASGDHWLEGFVVGLGVDLAVLTIVGSNLRYFFPRTGSNVSVGADGVNVAGH